MNNKRGAGRPPKDGQKRERIDARLPREMVAWLKQNGITETIEKLVEEKMNIKRIYTAWVSNAQGAGENVTGQYTSLNEIRRIIRARYGAGWTAHIQARDIDGDGQSVLMHGDSPLYEVETFTLRK